MPKVQLELTDGQYDTLVRALAMVRVCEDMLADTESDHTVERQDAAALSASHVLLEVVSGTLADDIDRVVEEGG